MDRLSVMQVFVKAAETGSFTAAAQALDMSPQMVGKYVASLEQRLGTRLLQRTTRRQSLTEAGRLFHAQAKHILEEIDAADADVLALADKPRGTLRITAPATLGSYRLVPALCDYLNQNPEVAVDLTLTDRLVDLVEEGYDIAIRIGALPDSSLIARSLSRYELIACASPDYLAKHGSPAVPADLANHQCLRYATKSQAPGDTWHFTQDGREEALDMRGRVRINDARALVVAAIAGCGIMLGAKVALDGEIKAGRLVRVLPGYDGPSRPVTLLYPADRHPSPKLRSFVDWATRLFHTRP